ncbi:hypothetical protein BC941DRAFT_513374 [Chlamydoabsidia padenii]|nr:hypothetical protein BC941DRAFT_513374 [Chlamydoabsidia padenii]
MMINMASFPLIFSINICKLLLRQLTPITYSIVINISTISFIFYATLRLDSPSMYTVDR